MDSEIYYFIGTAYAGKSTMVKRFAEKYHGIECRENYHDVLMDSLDKNEFPNICYLRDMKDWHQFVTRTPDEYLKWVNDTAKECEILELRILEDLKKQGGKIFVDSNICIETLKKISDEDHVIVMVTDPMVSVNRFFDRPDKEKQFLYQQLLKEDDPEAALENFRQILIKINSRESYEEFLRSGFKVIERDDSRSVEETMSIIEDMLKLR